LHIFTITTKMPSKRAFTTIILLVASIITPTVLALPYASPSPSLSQSEPNKALLSREDCPFASFDGDYQQWEAFAKKHLQRLLNGFSYAKEDWIQGLLDQLLGCLKRYVQESPFLLSHPSLSPFYFLGKRF
jgi:hypothetical protein